MMTIKMLRTARGSEDGVSVKVYERDEDYQVQAELGSTFVRNGDAERTGGDEMVSTDASEDAPRAKSLGDKAESKAIAEAPENKDLGKAPKNKQGNKPTVTYEAGKLYLVDGVVCIAAADKPGAEAALLPVDQLPAGERQALVDEGKLTTDGKIPA